LPKPGTQARHRFRRLAFESCRRLDFNIGQQAIVTAGSNRIGIAGDALAIAGIERKELRIGRLADRPRPFVVRSSVSS